MKEKENVMNIYKSVCNDIRLKSPSDLRAFIATLKKLIASGEIQQFFPTDAPFATKVQLSDINENEPWPADYIEWYFLSSLDNKAFQLTAETYHGTGGYWKIVN